MLRSPPHKSRGFFHRLCLHSHPKVFTSCTIFSPCTVLTPISDQRIHTEVFSEIARRCNAHFLSLFLSKFGSLGGGRSCAKNIYYMYKHVYGMNHNSKDQIPCVFFMFTHWEKIRYVSDIPNKCQKIRNELPV